MISRSGKSISCIAAVALAVAFLGFGQRAAGSICINELQPDPPGSDPALTIIELLGTPSSPFSGFIISIESDNISGAGTIDSSTAVSGTFDSDGLATVSIPDIENPSFTLVFSSLSPSSGDYDTDNDGTLNAGTAALFGIIYDAIGIPDQSGEPLYGASLGGADFASTGDDPQLVFRDGVTKAWYAINDPPTGSVAYDIDANTISFSAFDQDPLVTTFGATNPTTSQVVPEAGSIAVWATLGICGGGFAFRKRRV